MQETHGGLRERQRAETLQRIHDAAIDLVRDEGFTAATVANIADRAGVSRRTFFNYFPTKEDAVLGAGPATVPFEALDGLLDGPDQLKKATLVVHAVASSVRHVRTDEPVRRALVKSIPELRARGGQHHIASQELLAEALSERFDADDAARATALVMVGSAVLRYAYTLDPDIVDDPDSPALTAAVELFRTTLKDLT
ncbi:TetR/AcrR family transcriptional regulator [Gordonia malaquae]|uniref:Putative TetR family transcriptional regulator n=1 Tax=Gordonia malaquae NBRC 108250 TaxID=1223542 RepID=M3VDX8_GORML|nr:TetR family transcriptional regulator [Gordonia malaquae]GAC78809.1 putative TetR family transcriptional regulator [Gordonia malaquae NBRC 108250]SED67301.1 DNA-binding transcriptional regulator, AcrR family [Gordonia malaquae]